MHKWDIVTYQSKEILETALNTGVARDFILIEPLFSGSYLEDMSRYIG
jgi:hypothetical protein